MFLGTFHRHLFDVVFLYIKYSTPEPYPQTNLSAICLFSSSKLKQPRTGKFLHTS